MKSLFFASFLFLLAELSFKKRFPDGPSKDFKMLQKQKNFLSNKGFTFYQIESVLD